MVLDDRAGKDDTVFMTNTNMTRIATNTLNIANGTYQASWTGYELTLIEDRSPLLARTIETDVGCRGLDFQLTVLVDGNDVYQVLT